MKFYLTPERREHLLRHFAQDATPGSKFNPELFSTPESLIDFINEIDPHYIIQQNSTIQAYGFKSMPGIYLGQMGISRKVDLPTNDIIHETRDGYILEIGLVDVLPLTHECCVIAEQTDKGKSIITAFPGPYAPPLPNNNQSTIEFNNNQAFWNDHLLLRLRRTTY